MAAIECVQKPTSLKHPLSIVASTFHTGILTSKSQKAKGDLFTFHEKVASRAPSPSDMMFEGAHIKITHKLPTNILTKLSQVLRRFRPRKIIKMYGNPDTLGSHCQQNWTLVTSGSIMACRKTKLQRRIIEVINNYLNNYNIKMCLEEKALGKWAGDVSRTNYYL